MGGFTERGSVPADGVTKEVFLSKSALVSDRSRLAGGRFL